MAMASRSEMAIPKGIGEISSCLNPTIVVLGTVLAIFNLVFRWAGEGIIAAWIWLAIMAAIFCRLYREGAFRNFPIDILGFLAPRQFLESIFQDTGSVEIRYGFQLFGHRFFYFTVPLDKIISVAWGMGQDHRWTVHIWHEQGFPDATQARQHPGHKVYTVGPPRKDEKKAETLGLALVDFLRQAGATLMRGDNDHTFVRA